MKRSPRRPAAPRLLGIAGLLILVFAIRAHHPLAMPVFNDESLHIRRSEVVWTFNNPAISFTAGKLLGYYWLGAFHFNRLEALLGGRLVYALFVLLGAAATYRLGRSLFGRGAGLLALALYAVSPYLVFYERLILADQLAAVFGTLTIWAAVRLARRPTRRAGLLVGSFVSLAILAKLTAAPFALVPLVAIWMLGEPAAPGASRWARIVPPRYRRALGAAYGLNVITGLPFLLFPLFRQVQDEPVLLIGGNLFASSGWPQIFADNVPRLGQMLAGFFGLAAVIAALALAARAVVIARRPALYLVACFALPWIVLLIFARNPSNRYWLLGIPPLLVLVAGGAILTPRPPLHAVERGSRLRRAAWPSLALIGIGLWIALRAGPFIAHAWDDPRRLALPAHDRWEYYTNFSSGYGLEEAARFMPSLPISQSSGRVPVVGLVVGCHALRLYLPPEGIVDLSCPFFGWHGEYMDQVVRHIEQRLHDETVVYLLVEALPFTDLGAIPVRWELVRRFPRPFDGIPVELYRVYVNNS